MLREISYNPSCSSVSETEQRGRADPPLVGSCPLTAHALLLTRFSCTQEVRIYSGHQSTVACAVPPTPSLPSPRLSTSPSSNMASPATTPAVSSDFAFRLELTWNVELDITDKNLNIGAKVDEGEEAIIFGSKPWKFLAWWSDKERCLQVGIRPSAGKEGAVGRNVAIAFAFSWVDHDGRPHLIAGTDFEPAPFPETDPEIGRLYSNYTLHVSQEDWEETAAGSAERYDPKSHRSYRLTAVLEQGTGAISRKQAEDLAERTSGACFPFSRNLLFSRPASLRRSPPRATPP